ERQVETAPHLQELPGHPIAIGQRIVAELARLLEDVLRVLVVAHHDGGIDPGEPLVAGDDVRGNLLVSGAEVRPAVGVIDRRREITAGHTQCSPCRSRASSQALTARAWTSLIG